MYAFGPLPKYRRSGRIVGTHQKIDRIARRHLGTHLDRTLEFPRIMEILHFEGSRGPDGIKLKSPGRDEPLHFIDPSNITETSELLIAISNHSENLSQALHEGDSVRAAFEAAWLAHAVVDGLTPAHHEPLHKQVGPLKPTDEKQFKVRSKIIMTGGGSGKQFIANNWQYWGAKGLMTSHTLFEAGVAMTAKPLKFSDAVLAENDFSGIQNKGFIETYTSMIKDVADLQMYDEFKRSGWTRTLARQTTQILLPMIVRAVTLAWYDAYMSALEREKT